MTRLTKLLLIAALAATVATTAGCFRRVPIENAAEVRSVTERVAAGDARAADVEITMGAGDLTLSGSDLASDALTGDFVFAPQNLKPEVVSELNGDVMRVTIGQPDALDVPPLSLASPVNIIAKWDIELSNTLPVDLDLSLGAGTTRVDLSDVDVTELSVNLGAGDAKIDLSGERTHDLRGLIQTGAGTTEIRLPRDVPVRVTGHQEGLGNWDYPGFTTDGNTVVNDAWRDAQADTSATTGRIELNVQRGVGDVRLVLVD